MLGRVHEQTTEPDELQLKMGLDRQIQEADDEEELYSTVQG